MEKVRLGMIGCGVIGTIHLQMAVKSPDLEIVAVADLIEERARKAAADFGVGTYYLSGDEMLDDDRIQGVVLGFPAVERTPLAIRAFAKGKHVLTEKPVGANVQAVKDMIAARGDLVAACCSSRYRFLESSQAVTEFIAGGSLGDLRVVHCRCLSAAGKPPKNDPPTWRLRKSENGGGILMNWGCYDLDYLLGITGWKLRPELVLAKTWTVPPQFEPNVAPNSDAETYFSALIKCKGGTVINFERGEYMPAQTENSWQIVGTKGSLKLQMTMGREKKIIHDDTSTDEGVISKVLWEGAETGAKVHAGPIQDFAESIRDGRDPETTLEKALIVQKITDAIYASSDQGKAIRIK